MSRKNTLKNYNLNDTKPSNKIHFEVLYNALSVGWHLRKILEISPNIIDSQVEYDRFILWMTRHKILKEVKKK